MKKGVTHRQIDNRVRSLITLNGYAYSRLLKLSEKWEKPLATTCVEIIKAALKGDLVYADGKRLVDED